MTTQELILYAEIESIKIRVEAYKAANLNRQLSGYDGVLYTEEYFYSAQSEIDSIIEKLKTI